MRGDTEHQLARRDRAAARFAVQLGGAEPGHRGAQRLVHVLEQGDVRGPRRGGGGRGEDDGQRLPNRYGHSASTARPSARRCGRPSWSITSLSGDTPRAWKRVAAKSAAETGRSAGSAAWRSLAP